jgi:predicted helicase
MAGALRLSPTSKPIKQFYADLAALEEQGQTKETSVRAPFQELLTICARRMKWHFVSEQDLTGKAKGKVIDGVVKDENSLPRGYWEAKDDADDLDDEIAKKFGKHYPTDNILFQTPSRAVIFRGRDEKVFDEDIRQPEQLVAALETFFGYSTPQLEDWGGAVDEFKERIPELGRKLVALIEEQRKENPKFVAAFEDFAALCRQSINPNLADAALEEMLVQHILTERIFRSVFDNPDFIQRNAIAAEIEKAVTALASKTFSRAEFMKPLARFYETLEATAKSIQDFATKQAFLNSLYERFFQGFAVKAADPLGIVYTPQPIVEFMVNSVEALLKRDFGLSLNSQGVHIIDPFVGTGNFIVRIMRHMSPAALPRKYADEMHCNEVMLLPYYIASLNIEHEYLERVGRYEPFPGVCLVDTFELAETRHPSLFTEENTARVERQRAADMMVIIGNPPYNAHQVNENDNNKNRKYATIDGRVSETYAKSSTASNKNALNDPYVKAFRWATDRLSEKADHRGIVAFVSNNSFLDDFAFDGMRLQLMQDFDDVYILDLHGNVRKNPKLSGTTHNVFGIKVGVSINLLVRRGPGKRNGKVHYVRCGEDWRKEQKYQWLDELQDVSEVSWAATINKPSPLWLRDGLRREFEKFPPMGTREAKRIKLNTEDTSPVETVFKTYSNGVKTNRDTWAYNFSAAALSANMQRMIREYSRHVVGWKMEQENSRKKSTDAQDRRRLDDFVEEDPRKIGWSRDLKLGVLRGTGVAFSRANVRSSLYRPFCRQSLYFDPVLNEEVYSNRRVFPDGASESDNRSICVTATGSEKPFMVLASNRLVDLHLVGAGSAAQCFPFYTYAEDGTGRTENITDWALNLYREHHGKRVSKWDIFHYHYAVLHHPTYRERYAANLRKSLPRVPLVASTEDFKALVKAGERLADLHVNYEQQKEYKLREVWTEGVKANLRVEKMRLSKDRTGLVYNETLILEGVPTQAFNYKLGSRSALEWVVDQYQVSEDKASGIENDPNRDDDPGYIIGLVKKVITVSLETQKVVERLPELKVAKLS